MVTPLARRLKSLRRVLAEGASRFKLNQVLRLLTRAGLEVRVVADPSGVCRTEEVVAVRFCRGKQPVEVVVAGTALPSVVRAAGAEAVAEFVQTRYAAWVAAHPALAADAPLARQLRAIAAADVEGFDEFLAFAAGRIRRGSTGDFEAACSDYFGVSIGLETKSAANVRLRVGPLSWAEYCEFHPQADGAALSALLVLAGLFLGPAAAPDVLLVLRADETPACIPGTEGALVGLAAWPHESGRQRREDVEFLICNDALELEAQP